MAKKAQKGPTFDFVEQADKDRLEEAKKLLLEQGFSVSDPLKEEDLNNNVLSLVTFFYKKMQEKYINRRMNYHQTTKDRQSASVLVNSRKRAGAPTARAYQESRILIEALFEYEDLLGLKGEINSMSILGIDWVIKKLAEIINNENKIVGERNFSVYEDEFQSYIESEEFKLEKKKELDQIYRKVVVDGSKEES